MARQLTLLRWCVVVTLLGLLHVGLPEAQAETVKYWAVICGVADYERINDLNYTDDDANDLAAALQQYPEWQGSDQIEILIDSYASKEGIHQAIIDMGVKAKDGDVCLFFFSGHGTQVKDASRDERDRKDEAICAYDTYFSKKNVYNVITDDKLGSWLAAYLPPGADIVAIFDTCYAGGMAEGAKGPSVKSVRNPNLAPGAKVRRHFGRGLRRRLAARGAKAPASGSQDIGGANAVVLMACEEGASSWETGELREGAEDGNGVFSYYVVEGLGDPFIIDAPQAEDANGDHFISAEEDFDYAAPRTTEWFGQNPRLYDGDTDPDVQALLVQVGEATTTPVAPVAAFTAIPTSGDAPLTVTFTDESTGSITAWLWDFGDGGTSNERNPPTHEYTLPGTYTATLTVTGPVGTDTATQTITVTEEPADADVVAITKAEYKRSKGELKVEATSTAGGIAVLTVEGYEDYGPMTYDSRKNKYKFQAKGVGEPGATVTVTSSLGGRATAPVTYRGL